MVAFMETTGGMPTPDARDARSALQHARQVEDAIRRIDVPWWYFVLSAGLFAALILTPLLGDTSMTSMLVVAIAIVALNLLAARQAGVMGSGTRNRGYLTAMFLIFVVTAGSLLWYRESGAAWIVVAGSATAAVLMLIGGWLYRRNPS